MLNHQEVKVYRLCHHSFDGLTAAAAATVMDLSPRHIGRILEGIEKKAPQLFPTLTKLQARDYHLYVEEGWKMKEIAGNSGRTIPTVQKSIEQCVAKGMPKVTRKKREVLSYKNWMDGCVKEKF